MEGIDQLHLCLFLPLVTSLLLLWLITKWLFGTPPQGRNKIMNPPPSPRKLPIIGNLHQVGALAHRNLESLARKHGPIMLLHYGTVPVLIASSADAARQIMRTHDLTFIDRPEYKVFKKLVYDGKDVAFSKYSEHWRQAKSILVLHLLTKKRVQSFRSIREQETALFIGKIRECRGERGTVNLTEMFFELIINKTCRIAFGRKYSDSENGKKKIMPLLAELMKIVGAITIGDIFPWLDWISRVNGFDKRLDRVAKELDDFLEAVIQQHMVETPDTNGDQNFVDILLQIYNDKITADASLIGRDCIKALLLDVLGAGTDTISAFLEWTMAELLRHPEVMRKLQSEVRGIVAGGKQDISDQDLEKMHYLKAVIKESFRLHPPIPIIIPRVAREDVKVKGYDIAAGTLVMVNAWAIGRDPESWDEPQKFDPERFLNSDIDFKGMDLELIPFGAGRRGCPGIALALATIEFVLANVVHKFNWELPTQLGKSDLDMSEHPGATVHRALPLLAVPT